MNHSADGSHAPPSQERPTGGLVTELPEQLTLLGRAELAIAAAAARRLSGFSMVEKTMIKLNYKPVSLLVSVPGGVAVVPLCRCQARPEGRR